MFDTLLQLPLFQGLCPTDLTNILEKVKLHFIKYKTGETIVHKGETCDRLYFILKGEVSMTTVSDNRTLAVTECVSAPYLLEPYSLFGMNTSFRSAYTAETELNLITIDKKTVFKELLNYDIFRLNYMNMISNRVQTLSARLWDNPAQNPEERLLRFFLLHIQKPFGKKIIKIKMEDLAQYMDSTRSNISKMLNEFQEQGILSLRRKEILIHEASMLTERIKKKD